jgi:putative transcriptional regulator
MAPPKHHLDEALLLDYASGSLPGPFSLTVATHLAMCPQCRRTAEAMEAMGGAALAELPVSPVEDALLTQTLSCLGEPLTRLTPGERGAGKTSFGVPGPLRGLLDRPLEALAFKRLAGGEVYLLDAPKPFRSYVLRIAGGKTVPKHDHPGPEMTMVLRGGYSDGGQHFDEGDISVCDSGHRHAPHADPGGCICLVVSAGPLTMPDPLTALVARWFGV